MPSSLDFLIRRDDASKSSPQSPRRFPDWAIPAAIAVGFGLLFLMLFRDRLLPAREVETAAVLVTSAAVPLSAPSEENAPQANSHPLGGAMLFQASGWIEPDPLPVRAAALIDGVVASVDVLEGQQVEKGELLATLVEDDARLNLDAALQRKRMLISARAAHLAAIDGARRKQESAEAESIAANSLGDEARDLFGRFEALPKNAVSRSEVNSAKLRVERERSLYLAAQAKTAELASEVKRMELETATKDDEIALASVAVQLAELNFERTRIKAPIAGRVLRLLASPGDKKMLAMDHADSSTVCVLYDPAKLQVRVDVPLADAAKMQTGQRVRIHCGLLPEKVFSGEVTRITGEADVQRNTLQAKVRIDDPAGQLRPEMLCRVEFLESSGAAKEGFGKGATGADALAVWVNAKALREGAAWVYDPESGRVSKREVLTSTEERDGYMRVIGGLRPGEQTVLSQADLREGQRVKSTSLTK